MLQVMVWRVSAAVNKVEEKAELRRARSRDADVPAPTVSVTSRSHNKHCMAFGLKVTKGLYVSNRQFIAIFC